MNKNLSKDLLEPNIVVSAIAELLFNDNDEESEEFQKKYFETEKLDYTLESLKYIDKFLEKVRSKKQSLNDEQYSKIILRCGAYAGEVIRRLSQKDFSWILFDDALKDNKNLKDFGKSVLTLYILKNKKTKMLTFPMAKVEKYLSNGKVDSLHFYAQTIINA